MWTTTSDGGGMGVILDSCQRFLSVQSPQIPYTITPRGIVLFVFKVCIVVEKNQCLEFKMYFLYMD